MTATGGPEPAICSFCGRRSPDTGIVFTGPGVVICEQCVAHAHAYLRSGESQWSGGPSSAGSSAPPETRAISEAFAHLGDPGGPHGEDLPNVEAGDGLARYVHAGSARYPGAVVAFVVDDVHLLSGERAEVRFHTTGFVTMPFEGLAVREQGRWKVARSTLANLLARAGVSLPPRAA